MFSFGNRKPPQAPANSPAPQSQPGSLGMTPGGDDIIKDSTDRTFMADVIDASRQVPVIVDFWAPWCGPCKQLGPILEKAVRAAKGRVKLVKVDTDRNQAIAQQLRVQSIPAVYAFFQGRPVDGFAGALPESQVKQFVDRLVQLAGPGDDEGGLEQALAAAKELLDGGNPAAAADIYAQILEAEPENAPAYAGLARALIAAGQIDDAKGMLDTTPAAIAKDKEIVAAKAALEVALQARNVGPTHEFTARLANDPNDHQARFDLAMALYAGNQHQAAVDELLELVRRDRTWNEEAGRKQLVKFFEALGHTHPLTISSRRRLSTILFS